jgi:PAS domain S-box-containing protein
MSKQTNSDGDEQGFDVAGLCRNFSELSPQPMVAVEGNTHVVRYLNAAFARLVGKRRGELIGRPFAEAVPEGEANGCLALLDRVFATGTPESLDEQQHGKTSPVFWSYSVWAILGGGEHPQPVGVVIQVTDATEIATFRGQVVAMNEQLLISGTRQHELTESAEKANRIKDEFLATLSHELRTPLTVIIGWTQLLGHPSLSSDEHRRGIEVVRRNAQMQSQLIEDLLDVSRIVTGKLRLNTQPVDLNTICAIAVDGLRPTAQAKEIDLELRLDDTRNQVMGDADRLQQVAWNLISNALKFTPRGGQVRVQLKRVDSQVEVIVSDTGQGIASEFLPHIFDRFRQADATTTRTQGGLGLGLSIVRQLIELHGGSVRAHSEGKGCGSTFTVTLPLMVAPGAPQSSDAPQREIQTPEFECPPQLQDLRVLVVDDEADTRDMLRTILETCGARVKVAGSAAAALEAVGEDVFDVLISDIGMPEEDGYSLLAKVRALAGERGEKVPAAAALTAYVAENDRIRAFQAGFQMHVPKPISPSELIAVVTELASNTR